MEHRDTGTGRETAAAAQPSTIWEAFRSMAGRRPDALAVLEGISSTTYGGMKAMAEGIAEALHPGIGREDRPAAVLCSGSTTGTAAILGALRAGRPYSLVNPDLPGGRILDILADLGDPEALLDEEASRQLKERGVPLPGRIISVEEVRHPGPGFPCPRLRSSSSLAAVIHTSGSTGAAKGVMRDQRSILFPALKISSSYSLGDGDVFAVTVPLSKGIPTVIFPPLLRGAALAVYPLEEWGLSPLPKWLEENRVSHLQLHAALLREMLDGLPEEFAFSRLRCVIPQYRFFRRDLERLFRHLPPSATVVHGLGSVETGRAVLNFLNRESVFEGDVVPVGFPVEGTEVRLVDGDGNPAAPGEVGEIELRSSSLCSGYWNNPELTARTFLPDPEDPRRRVFRTGDLAKRLKDGSYAWVGRKDFRTKVRGRTVYLEEVECALQSLPQVRDAAAVSSEREDGDSVITAYVVPEREGVEVREIREALLPLLPGYAVPSLWSVVKELPVLGNGKVDRQGLLRSGPAGAPVPRVYEAPRGEMERKIASEWERVLGVRPVGRRDNFFELGGHSLLAFRLVDRILGVTGVSVPPSLLLEAPTVSAMAERVASGTPFRGRCLFPLSESEGKRKLFLVPPPVATAMYFLPLSRELEGDFSVYAFQSVALDGETAPHGSIGEAAEHYLGELAKVQPHGPYLLGGKCVGAYTALEMAGRLRDRGEEVELLVVFDTLGFLRKNRKKRKTLSHYWAHRNLYREKGILKILKGRLLPYLRPFLIPLLRLASRATASGSAGRALLSAVQGHAIRKYRPRFHHGKTLLILNGTWENRKDDPDVVWAKPEGGLIRVVVPGSAHRDLPADPSSASLAAEAIRRALEPEGIVP